jgi:hypothetical protein
MTGMKKCRENIFVEMEKSPNAHRIFILRCPGSPDLIPLTGNASPSFLNSGQCRDRGTISIQYRGSLHLLLV